MRAWRGWPETSKQHGRGACLVLGAALALTALPGTGASQLPDSSKKKPRPPGITGVMTQAATSLLAQVPRMPSVRGLTLDSARRVLAPHVLPESLTYRGTTDSLSDGLVADQSPEPGTPVRRRLTPVQLTVYRYTPPRLVPVPAVRGFALSQAIAVVVNARLTPRSGAKLARTMQATVVDQSPESGTMVPAGSDVVLTLDVVATVPDVRGDDRAVARRRLGQRSLAMVERGEEFADAYPAGLVTRQHPDSGATRHAGDTVDVWISLGAHPVEPSFAMPPLLGRPMDQALAMIQKAQLSLVHVDSVVDPARAGRVTAQVPNAGEPVHRGDAVTVAVAVPPASQRVPWVVGRTWEAGSAMMKGAGFVAQQRNTTTSAAPPGTILQQSEDSGRSLPLGSTVVLTVADRGVIPPPARTMPNVKGLTVARARERLGFLLPEITEEHVPSGNKGEDGVVRGQVPAAGEPVVAPVDVVLQVGRYQGPPPPPRDSVRVPLLTSYTLAQARGQLDSAGLTLGTVTLEEREEGVDSLVTSQRPIARTTVARGSSVSVVLARVPATAIDWWKVFEILAGSSVAGLLLHRLVRRPKPPGGGIIPPPVARVRLVAPDDLGGEVGPPPGHSVVALDVRLVEVPAQATLALDDAAPLIAHVDRTTLTDGTDGTDGKEASDARP